MAELMGIIIPGALAFIMFGMGMGLKVVDFTQLVKFPRAFGIGLSAQILLLPIVAWGVIQLFSMPQVFAVGLLVIA
ncbi:MAG: bile acid:sodium symporter family protein, partial [Gammaproteobacteria bacterium]